MIAALVALSFTLPAASAFVAADVANLRKAAAPDAPIVQQLRIGAPVDVVAAAAGWSEVKAVLGTGRVVQGFVKADLLAPSPLDVKAAKLAFWRALDEAKLDDALLLAQRIAAQAPGDESAQRLLRDALRARGDTDGALRVDAILKGAVRVHVAQCVAGVGAVLIVQLDGDARRTTLPCEAGNDARSGDRNLALREPARLARSLAVEPWFELKGDGTVRDVGPLEFADARAAAPRDDGRAGGVLQGARVVLGPCSEPGAVFATAPLAPIPARTASGPSGAGRARRLDDMARELLLAAHQPFRGSADYASATPAERARAAPELTDGVVDLAPGWRVASFRDPVAQRLAYVDVLGARDVVAASWGDAMDDPGSEGETLVDDARWGTFVYGGRVFVTTTMTQTDASGGGWRKVGWFSAAPGAPAATMTCELSMTYGD